MEFLKGISIYLGIIIGFWLLFTLPGLISEFITNIKYQRRLKKITPDLFSFELEEKQKQHLKMADDFQLQQKELISVFKINIDGKKTRTVDDFVKEAEKERSDKRRKKRHSYRRY